MTLFLTLAAIAIIMVIWVAWIEPRKLVVRHFQCGLTNVRHPFRAVIVADIQPNSYHWPAARLKDTFARVATEEQPDLVFWLGDYYNAPTDKMKEYLADNRQLKIWVERHLPRMRDIADAMVPLRGRLGTYAILGNHDWAWSGSRTQSRLEEFGVTVLKDDVVHLHDEATGQKIDIIGYEDLSSGRTPDYARVHASLDPNAAHISLSHSPDAFPVAAGGAEIMLSGHTHGGQVRLPFIGPLLLPIHYKKYDRGWFRDGDRHLFVSSGLGTSLPPFRLLCPPEIVVIDFVPTKDGDDEQG